MEVIERVASLEELRRNPIRRTKPRSCAGECPPGWLCREKPVPFMVLFMNHDNGLPIPALDWRGVYFIFPFVLYFYEISGNRMKSLESLSLYPVVEGCLQGRNYDAIQAVSQFSVSWVHRNLG